ncbi:hypothetical protein PCC7424_5454 (plasmid) [Gloeothece citriformis PCC 7424]|uniref:Uncharacterized protein n=1 Tax=Gloeothece citriformis (strain PCC 7424) TaxID=65393 RepID=B7KLT8_GLOC7|nr:hypothetical protein [Gloeothece citriformis]ACK73760.1 hypothetical protein PCC7424_5693 [Gloeothece citriformis PCC 7424]ACK74026.1 hypothetical protein PCC7424_5454 [Gloeothece citriformis PCC 7424]
MTVTPVSESHVQQAQSALMAFAQTILQMQALKQQEEKEKKEDKEPKENQSSQQTTDNMTKENETNGKSNQVAIDSNQLNGKKEKLQQDNKQQENQKNTAKSEEKDELSEIISFIQIWQNGNLIKGKTDEGKEVNNLNPFLDGQLQMAHQLGQPGQQIKGLQNVEVKFHKEDKNFTLFKTDKEGKVEVNANFSSPQQQVNSQQRKESPVFSKAIETKAQGNPDILSLLIKDLIVFREEMKTQVRAGFKDEVQQAVDEALKERLKKPRDYQWWQKASKQPGGIWELWKSRKEEQNAANTILKLWQKNAARGDKIYQGNDYTIRRDGNQFKLEDNTGKALLSFQKNSFGRAFVVQSDLTQKDLGAIKDLKNSLNEGTVTEDFNNIDRVAILRDHRTNTIVNELRILAKQHDATSMDVGKDIKYFINVSPDGAIDISRKTQDEQKPKLIFQRDADGMVNEMSSHDLDFLEKHLRIQKEIDNKIMQQARQQTNNVSSSRGRGRGR